MRRRPGNTQLSLVNNLNTRLSLASAECTKFSEDVKHWAEFQTGVKVFEPWMKRAEGRKLEGNTRLSLVNIPNTRLSLVNTLRPAEADLSGRGL